MSFALRASPGASALFGLLRLPWIEAHVAAAAHAAAGAVAARRCSARRRCRSKRRSRAAAPTRWRCVSARSSPTRRPGARGWPAPPAAPPLILALNTLRIGTLGRAAASPRVVQRAPRLRLAGGADARDRGYVFAWMRARGSAPPRGGVGDVRRRAVPVGASSLADRGVLRAVFLGRRRRSISRAPRVLAVAALRRPRRGRSLSRPRRQRARAPANVLATPRGALPGHAGVHLDAADPGLPRGGLRLRADLAAARAWPSLAALPLFIAARHRAAAGRRAARRLGRLAAVPHPRVLPAAARRAVVVCVAALWRHGGRDGRAVAASGAVAGVLFVAAARRALHAARSPSSGGRRVRRSAGALALPPGVPGRPVSSRSGSRRSSPSAGGGSSAGSRLLGVDADRGAARRCTLLSAHAGVAPQVRDVRAWALAGPVLIFAAVVQPCPAAPLKPPRSPRWR